MELIYVADFQNGRIEVFDPSGVFLYQFGHRGAGDAQFIGLSTVVVDDLGNLYAVDSENFRIQKFQLPAAASSEAPPGTPVSSATLAAASLTASEPQFLWASEPGLFGQAALQADGNLAVVGIENPQVYVVSPDGEMLETWGEPGTEDGQFSTPGNIAIDADGNFYVTDYMRNRIQKFAPDHSFITAWGSTGPGDGQFEEIGGLAIDADGNIYVPDVGHDTIQKFDPDGNLLLTIGSPGTAPGQLGNPANPTFDRDGNLLVAEFGNNRISKFAPDGTFISAFGSPGGQPGEFGEANGVDVDANGTIYVADFKNGRICGLRCLRRLPVPVRTPGKGRGTVHRRNQRGCR